MTDFWAGWVWGSATYLNKRCQCLHIPTNRFQNDLKPIFSGRSLAKKKRNSAISSLMLGVTVLMLLLMLLMHVNGKGPSVAGRVDVYIIKLAFARHKSNMLESLSSLPPRSSAKQ